MVSSYAQSGKLFEERRAANGVRQIPPTGTNHGGAIQTGFHKDVMAFKPLPSNGSMIGVEHASSDPDIDWLNRVPLSARRFSPHEEHPVVVEAPYGDIPLSQLTDENTSQHSGSQSNSATGNIPQKQSLFSGRQGVQQAALARFQPRATPKRPTMTPSRFGHLSTPRRNQNLTVPITPAANISVASSNMSYKPRSQNKIERRSWSESFKSSSSTPFAPSRACSQQAVLLSQPSVTNTVCTPRRAGKDEGGRFSFSRAPMVDRFSDFQPNMQTSSRSGIAAFEVSSDKYVQEQMRKLDEKASAMQEILATMQASAISDIIAVTTTTVSDLDQVSKGHVLQFEQQASQIREENVQEVKATFEILRSQLVNGCLPFMREQATSILASLTQGPSFLKMISPWSDRPKHVIKNKASNPWIPDRSRCNMLDTEKEVTGNPIEPQATPNKLVATTIKAKTKLNEPKMTPTTLVAIAKKAESKPIEPKTQAAPRRSKRNAAHQSRSKTVSLTKVGVNRVSPLVSASRRAKRQKLVEYVTTASPVLGTRKISQPIPKADEPRGIGTDQLASLAANWMSPKLDKTVGSATTASLVGSTTRNISQPTPSNEPCSVGFGRRISVVANLVTSKRFKKKRKRLFGRISREEGSISSPESYAISSRRYLKPDDNVNTCSPGESYFASSRKKPKPDGSDNASSPYFSSSSSRKRLKLDGNANTSSLESSSISSRKKSKYEVINNTSAPKPYSISSREKFKPDVTRTTHATSSVQVKSVGRAAAAFSVKARSNSSGKKFIPNSNRKAHTIPPVQVKSVRRGNAAVLGTIRSNSSCKKIKSAGTRTAHVTSSVQDESAGRAAPAAMPVNVRSKKGGLRSRKKKTSMRAPAKTEAEDCFNFRF